VYSLLAPTTIALLLFKACFTKSSEFSWLIGGKFNGLTRAWKGKQLQNRREAMWQE
jgi:uncharacterized membrane protein YbaN (DUF454 family)